MNSEPTSLDLLTMEDILNELHKRYSDVVILTSKPHTGFNEDVQVHYRGRVLVAMSLATVAFDFFKSLIRK